MFFAAADAVGATAEARHNRSNSWSNCRGTPAGFVVAAGGYMCRNFRTSRREDANRFTELDGRSRGRSAERKRSGRFLFDRSTYAKRR